MVKVSFVIPAYNAENTLEKCLKTILNQEVDKEIIVVDDESTDATRDISKRMGVKYIKIAHAGASATRNVGMENASGEYIALIDADTYLPAGWINAVLKNDFEKNDIITTYSEIPPFLKEYITKRYEKEHLMTPEKFDSVANGAVFKKEKKHFMKFDLKFIVGGEDNDVVLRALKNGAKIYVDTKNFYQHYHIHTSQAKKILKHIQKKVYFSYGDTLVMLRHWNFSKEVRGKLKDTWPYIPLFPIVYATESLKANGKGKIIERKGF